MTGRYRRKNGWRGKPIDRTVKRGSTASIRHLPLCTNRRCPQQKEIKNGECGYWAECPLFQSEAAGGDMTVAAPQRQSKYGAEKVSLTTEDNEQEIVIEYCKLKGIEVVHIANEGKRSIAYGARTKRLGLRKGFPDLFFPYAQRGFHGLFIEMKRDIKSKATIDQRWWIEYLTKQGYRAVVCYGSNEAMKEIELYFSEKE